MYIYSRISKNVHRTPYTVHLGRAWGPAKACPPPCLEV